MQRTLFDQGTRLWCLAVVVVAVFSLSPAAARADDWPQWLGPKRDGVWRESGLVDRFPDKGLPVRWRTAIDAGYSGPAVAGDRVYVTDRMLAPGSKAPPSGSAPRS